MKRLIILLIIGTLVEFSVINVIGASGDEEKLAEDPLRLVKNFLSFPTPTPTATPTPTPTPTPSFGHPVQIEVAAINLNTTVEEVTIDGSGNMGVPQNFASVGWYALGAKLGWRGNAVITGHYDDIHGQPAAFYHLRHIPLGADILLSDDMGRKLVYRVYASESRPVGSWVLEEIFGPSEERRLNLITCSGWWNPRIRNYSHRHIVFSHLVEEALP